MRLESASSIQLSGCHQRRWSATGESDDRGGACPDPLRVFVSRWRADPLTHAKGNWNQISIGVLLLRAKVFSACASLDRGVLIAKKADLCTTSNPSVSARSRP